MTKSKTVEGLTFSELCLSYDFYCPLRRQVVGLDDFKNGVSKAFYPLGFILDDDETLES